MDAEAQMELQTHLDSGERLLWSGRPKQGLFLRPADAFLIPFSLLWGGIVFFWQYSVLSMGEANFFALFGAAFVLVGAYIIIGRFFVDARQRQRTIYGVTDQRVIIISGLVSRNVKSLNLRTLSEVSLTQRKDGTGSISFGPVNPYSRWSSGGAWPGMPQPPMFELIPQAKSVYDTIRNAQNAPR